MKKSIQKRLYEELLSDEAKRDQFRLFEFANLLGILVAIMGVVIIEILLEYFTVSAVSRDNSKLDILWVILIIGVIAYFVLRYLAKQTIGMIDEKGTLIPYTPNIKDQYKNFNSVKRKLLEEEFTNDKSSPYSYIEEKGEEWDTKIKEGELLFGHEKSKFDIYIYISKQSFKIIRPTIKEAKEFQEDFIRFLDILKKSRIIKDYGKEIEFIPENVD